MADEAILAPVPAELLQDALDSGYARVAFGSMAWEFFRRLTDDHADEPLLVLLYASHADELALEVRWTGVFGGWRDAAEAERDPDFEKELRSPLARFDWAGNQEAAPGRSTGSSKACGLWTIRSRWAICDCRTDADSLRRSSPAARRVSWRHDF